MENTTLLAAFVLAASTFQVVGLVVVPESVQGSGPPTVPPIPQTPQAGPCAENDITQIPTTDDSEEIDSDIECEFYGPGDFESEGQQVPPDTDDFAP